MSRVKLLVTAAVIVAGTAMAAPANAQRVVVFGDSLSDTGNAQFATGGANPGSPLGRFSNGLNWVDLLYGSGATGIGTIPANPNSFAYDYTSGMGTIPPGKVLDYAFGGAYAGIGNVGNLIAPGVPFAPGFVLPTPPAAPGTTQEIAKFASAPGGTFAPNDTVAIWAGANNGFYALGVAAVSPPANAQAIIGGAAVTAAANEAGNLGSLVGLGAKKIIVVNLPDLGATPAAIAGGASAQQGGSLYSSVFNAGLAQGVGQLAALFPTTNFIQADVASLFRLVTANPGAFGFTNTTTPCGFNPVPPSACAGFAFADPVHPTQASYALVAQYIGLLSNATPALLQTARLGESGLYTNELLTNAVFDRMSAFVTGTYAGKNGPFAEVLGSYSNAGNSSGQPGFAQSIGGVRGGIDKKNGATLTGASVAYIDGSQSSGSIKNDIQSARADIYGTAMFGNAYISADAGISSLTLSGIKRDTGFPTVIATGHTGGFVASAAAEAGYALPMGGWTLIPSGRVTYFHSEVNGYDEAAPILAMSFADRQIDAVLIGGRLRAAANVPGIGLAAVGYGEVGYEGYVSSSTGSLKSSFINNTAFPTLASAGDPVSPGILGKVGLSSQVSAGMYLDFQYGIAVHDDGGQTHSGDLRLKASY